MTSETLLDDQFSGRDIEISDLKFLGKLAGKKTKYNRTLNYLGQTKKLIFFMSVAVFYPIITSYLFHDFFRLAILIERIIFCCIFLTCVLLFSKFRLTSIIISLLLLALIILNSGWSAFNIAIFCLNAVGIFFHFKEIKQRKELLAEAANGHPDIIRRK